MLSSRIKQAVTMQHKTFSSKVAAKRKLDSLVYMKTFLMGQAIKAVRLRAAKTMMIVMRTPLIVKLALKLIKKARENSKMCPQSECLKVITCRS